MITRRALAWSAPVVVAAAAVPAVAASTGLCDTELYLYRPSDHPKDSSLGPRHNIAEVEVVVGSHVTIRIVRDYPHASALNIDHEIVVKRDDGWRADETFTWPLEGCTDPEFIQLDGNNAHYYGGGLFR